MFVIASFGMRELLIGLPLFLLYFIAFLQLTFWGRFMAGTQEEHKAIQMTRAAKVVVTAVDGTLPAHGDGETICTDGVKLSIEMLPAQLELITNT